MRSCPDSCLEPDRQARPSSSYYLLRDFVVSAIFPFEFDFFSFFLPGKISLRPLRPLLRPLLLRRRLVSLRSHLQPNLLPPSSHSILPIRPPSPLDSSGCDEWLRNPPTRSSHVPSKNCRTFITKISWHYAPFQRNSGFLTGFYHFPNYSGPNFLSASVRPSPR